MQNKNIVTKKVIYGITGLTLLILAISLGTQTPSSAQIPPAMNGNNNNTTIFYPYAYLEWDKSSEFISGELNAPVFSFHVQLVGSSYYKQQQFL